MLVISSDTEPTLTVGPASGQLSVALRSFGFLRHGLYVQGATSVAEMAVGCHGKMAAGP